MDGIYPPEDLIQRIGGGDFVEIGETFKQYFINYGGLKPGDYVLEIGCGCGRMAVPLTTYLKQGPCEHGIYEGFDIVKELVDWCEANIASQYPNFNFQRVDLFSTEYNKNAVQKAENFQFPYQSDYFDFVFLTSVFTHMLPEALANYLKEISRVLKPKGCMFSTFFLLNREARSLILSNNSSLIPKLNYLFYQIADESVPESAVFYDDGFIMDLLEKVGFKCKTIHYGNWCGRTKYVDYQDIIIAEKSHV